MKNYIIGILVILLTACSDAEIHGSSNLPSVNQNDIHNSLSIPVVDNFSELNITELDFDTIGEWSILEGVNDNATIYCAAEHIMDEEIVRLGIHNTTWHIAFKSEKDEFLNKKIHLNFAGASITVDTSASKQWVFGEVQTKYVKKLLSSKSIFFKFEKSLDEYSLDINEAIESVKLCSKAIR